MPTTQKLTFKVPEGKSLSEKEVLVRDINKISDAVNQLLLSGLNEDAVIVLLVDATGIGKRTIQNVLRGIASLRELYTHE